MSVPSILRKLLLPYATLLTVAFASNACGDELTVNSWGGSFQDIQSEHVFETFETATGLDVKELSDGENMFSRARLQVETGESVMDVMMGDASWLSAGKELGLWAPIDPAIVPIDELHSDAVDPFGIAALYWSFNIVSNSELLSNEDSPSNWSDVWEFALENPGRVALFGARPNYTIEVALLADGVELEDVYPLNASKIERAYASLDRIKDNVVWYETGDEAQRLLSSEEVVVAMFYGGDTFQLIDQGIPLQLTWNQGILTRDYWLVLRNAPNMDAAQRFVAHASSSTVQADFSRSTGFGPSNPASDSLLADISQRMPTAASNKDLQLAYDHNWWGPQEAELLSEWLGWLQQ